MPSFFVELVENIPFFGVDLSGWMTERDMRKLDCVSGEVYKLCRGVRLMPRIGLPMTIRDAKTQRTLWRFSREGNYHKEEAARLRNGMNFLAHQLGGLNIANPIVDLILAMLNHPDLL